MSSRTTARASRRSQPREAKSASALFTVSREAPTSWASSSWVRSCATRSPSSVGRPKRSDRSSSALATRPGTSREHQVGECLVGAPQPAGEGTQQVPGHVGAAVQPLVEVVRADPEEHGVGDGGPGRVAGPGVEQRQLAEHLAGAEDGQQVLAPVARRAAQLDLAFDDDVEPVAAVALVEDRVPARAPRRESSSSAAPRRPPRPARRTAVPGARRRRPPVLLLTPGLTTGLTTRLTARSSTAPGSTTPRRRR